MKLFRRMFFVFSLCVFALSAASLTSAIGSAQSPADYQQQEVKPQGYVIRKEGDNVAVYTCAGQYIGTLDVRFADLPEEDRQLLECGVLAEDELTLMSLIEDYAS